MIHIVYGSDAVAPPIIWGYAGATLSFPVSDEDDEDDPEDEGVETETGWSPYDPMWQRTGQAHGDHMEVGNNLDNGAKM